MNRRLAVLISGAALALAVACDPPESEEEEQPQPERVPAELVEEAGDGPPEIDDGGIDSIPDDPELVEKGEHLYLVEGCAACHLMDKEHTGPALRNITEERSASWLAKVIMHPGQMREKDPLAQHIAEQYPAPMPETNVDAETALAILAYMAAQ